MELEDLATSCDGDSATEKYINKIEVELARLRETEKRLREINHSLKDDNANYFSRNLELEQERDQLKVCCERLRIAALNAVSMMPGGGTKAALRDAYDETPEQSLAAHDSKVVERFCDYAQTKYHFGLHSVAKDYANQLRQQANGAME
jgi:hypothetical protein